MTENDNTTPDPTVHVADESGASSQVETGYLSGPGFTDVPVRYSVHDGHAFYQGCIDMGPVDEVRAHTEDVRAQVAQRMDLPLGGPDPTGTDPEGASLDGIELEARGIGRPPSSSDLWTNGVVPFVVDGGLPNQQRITDAVAHLRDNTPIRFVPRTTQNDYVRFVRNPNVGWSSSPIGRRGGEQIIRISDGASMGTVVHECFHTLGVLHEQSRCDRDAHVTINFANIDDDFESNFDRFCAGFQDYFDYDYDSIMHYGPTAFSTNGQPTIVPKKRGVTIGQRAGLSVGDRLTIAEMYSRFTGKGHTGVWRQGSGAYGLWVNATWESFVQKWQQWAGLGLRLVDIDVRKAGSSTRYSGVWRAGTGGYALWANATWESFVQKWQQWGTQGLRLVDMSSHGSGANARYSGVWLPGTGGYALWANASWDSFVQKWQQWGAQGLRLVDVNVQRHGGDTRYSGVWLPGTGGYALWANASWASFVAKWQQWAGQGLRLVDINVHRSGSDTRYSGVWLPGTDGYYLWANAPWEAFRARWEDNASKGLRLVDYELTISQDAADLDSAGLPVTAEVLEDGFGGVFAEDGSPMVEEAAETTDSRLAPQAEDAGDGMGGLVLAGADPSQEPTAASADSGDGMGGLVSGDEAPATSGASAADGGDQAEDGMGGLVAGSSGSAEVDLTVSTDGAATETTDDGRGGLVGQRSRTTAGAR
ncbi:M12 family metallopeptidase [Aquipuribacter nitratireducens]|uniref:M12 family metallopeptidase n=1 Tax=Aquipuribacter nitratireducens TaxID=650104 RepID=A0ABW0GH52_9MICO